MSRNISVRLDDYAYQKLESLAQQERNSIGGIAKSIIETFLDERPVQTVHACDGCGLGVPNYRMDWPSFLQKGVDVEFCSISCLVDFIVRDATRRIGEHLGIEIDPSGLTPDFDWEFLFLGGARRLAVASGDSFVFAALKEAEQHEQGHLIGLKNATCGVCALGFSGPAPYMFGAHSHHRYHPGCLLPLSDQALAGAAQGTYASFDKLLQARYPDLDLPYVAYNYPNLKVINEK